MTNVTPIRVDPTNAARQQRHRARQKVARGRNVTPPAQASAQPTPSTDRETVTTLQVAQLAGRLHGGDLSVSPGDAALASRLLGALVRMLPRDASIEIDAG